MSKKTQTQNNQSLSLNPSLALSSQSLPEAKALSTGPGPQAEGPVENAHAFNPTAPMAAYGAKKRVALTFAQDGKTRQEFKAESDINTIMARYQRTGIIENTRQTVAQYLDVTGADFQEAQNFIAGARSMFHSLPSKIRARFENDPGNFLHFMEDKRNHEEARELGLLPREAVQATPLPTPPASVQSGASSQDVAALAATPTPPVVKPAA